MRLGLDLHLSDLGTLQSTIRHVERRQTEPSLLGVCVAPDLRSLGVLHQPFCVDDPSRLDHLPLADALVLQVGHTQEHAHRIDVSLWSWSCVRAQDDYHWLLLLTHDRVNLCSIGRLIYSIKPTLDSIWDLTWHSPTTTGLAAIEINLASVCAALPIFWPVVKEKWNRIVVTYEVKVTSENGKFVPLRNTKSREEDGQKVELAERGQGGKRGFEPTEWDPYVRDTKTALGDVQTTVQSPAERPVKINKDTSFLM